MNAPDPATAQASDAPQALDAPQSPDARTPDAASTLVDRLPARVRPYARLARWDRPVGWRLLLWPCLWGLGLAAAARPEALAPGRVVLIGFAFALGAIAMRGAGCTYNDVVDRDIDRAVARTRARPVASGRVGVRAALAFAGLQALVGALTLTVLNAEAATTAVASLLFVAAYPFAKRVTRWPQAVLGLAFAWGVPVGWVAVTGALSGAASLLYAGAVLWIIGYDTVYAHQDREDDALIGIGSTALRFGARTGLWLTGLYASCVVLLLAGGLAAGAGLFSLIGLCVFAGLLARQVVRLDIDDPAACLRLFKSNDAAGLALALGVALDWGRAVLSSDVPF